MKEVWLGKNSDKRRYRVVSTARSQAFAYRTVTVLEADDGTLWRYIGHTGKPIPWNARLVAVPDPVTQAAYDAKLNAS